MLYELIAVVSPVLPILHPPTNKHTRYGPAICSRSKTSPRRQGRWCFNPAAWFGDSRTGDHSCSLAEHGSIRRRTPRDIIS